MSCGKPKEIRRWACGLFSQRAANLNTQKNNYLFPQYESKENGNTIWHWATHGARQIKGSDWHCASAFAICLVKRRQELVTSRSPQTKSRLTAYLYFTVERQGRPPLSTIGSEYK